MINEIEKIFTDELRVPSLPTIFDQINEAIVSPTASISDIGKIISSDAGLTARLLRLANSSFYGFPSQIDTINRALVVVGTRELRDLALGTSVVSLFNGIPKDIMDMESFWRHSIACGVTAKILGIFRNDCKVERLFVAGLLHDIGQLIFCNNFPNKVVITMLRSNMNGELLSDIEKDLLGHDHAEVGGMLMKKWNIIDSIEEPISHHHTPQDALNHPIESAIVHIADIIASAMQLGHSGERYVPPLDEGAWQSVGFSADSLSLVIQQTERQYEEVVNSILLR